MRKVFVEVDLPEDHGVGDSVNIQSYRTGVWHQRCIIAVHGEPAVRHHEWYVRYHRDCFVDQEIGG